MSNGFPGGDQVVIKLVVDTKQAEQDVKKLGDALKDKEHEAQAGIGAKTAALVGGVGGFAYHAISELGEWVEHHILTVGMAEENARRAMVGTLSMIDKNGMGYAQLNDLAIHYRNSIDDIAVATGTAAPVVTKIFDELITYSGQSSDKVLRLTKDISSLGGIGGGPEHLIYGFRMLELGMTGARNPLVRLIMSTETLKGSLKSVSQQLAGMDAGKRFEIAEKAVRKMSETMKSGPTTWSSMQASMKEAAEQIAEDMGLPVARGIYDALKPFADRLVKNADTLKWQAAGVGNNLGDFFRGISKGFQSTTDFDSALQEVIGSNGGIRTFGDALAKLGPVIGKLGSYVWGAAQALVHLQPGGWAMALAGADSGDYRNPKGAQDLRNNPFASRKDVDAFFANQDKYDKGELFGNARDPNMRYGMTWGQRWRYNFEDFMSPTGGAAYRKETLAANRADWYDAADSGESRANDLTGVRQAAASGNYEPWRDQMDKALASQNDAMVLALGGVLYSSTKMQDALVRGASGVDEAHQGMIKLNQGVNAMSDALERTGTGKDFAKFLMNKVEQSIKGAQITQNFGNVYITQDFKDNDPDRVALVFQRDLARAATAPRQASNTLPGGW